MKNKRLIPIVVAVVAVIISIPICTRVMGKSPDIKEECKENDISYTFVSAVMEVDDSYDTGLPASLTGYFKEYEDPYYVLLCHKYGEEKASQMTEGFTSYTDDKYVDQVFAAEKKLISADGEQ